MSYIDSTGSPCSFGPINGSCPEVPKMPGAFLETSKAKAGKVGKFSSNFRNGGAETRKFLGSSFRRCWMDGKGCWKTPFYKGSNSTLWKMLVYNLLTCKMRSKKRWWDIVGSSAPPLLVVSDIWRKRKCFNFPRWPYQLTTVCTSHAPPETNNSTWNLMLGRRSFPFGDGLIFRGELLVFREGKFHTAELGSWPLLPEKISKPVDLLPALDRQWRGLAGRVGRCWQGRLRFQMARVSLFVFLCPQNVSARNIWLGFLMWYISYIYIHIYIYMDSWSIQHVDLLMISDIQSPKTPKPKIS